MRFFKGLNIILLFIIIVTGCSNEQKQTVEVIADTSINSEFDTLKLNHFKKIAIEIVGNETFIEDETIRSTPERLTYSFSVKSNLLNSNLIDKIIKSKGAKLLLDNHKGAKIYCLNNQETFEIHQPLSVSRKSYDMNNSQENKGIFKIVQLSDSWNLRFFLHKNDFNQCN